MLREKYCIVFKKMTKKSQREQKKIILKKEVFPEILNENSQKISNGHVNKLSEKSIIIKKKKKKIKSHMYIFAIHLPLENTIVHMQKK